jgi:hypothetical protein
MFKIYIGEGGIGNRKNAVQLCHPQEIRKRKPHLYVDSDDNYTQLKKQLQQIVIDEIKDSDQTLKESEVKEKAKYFKPKSSAGFEPAVELENRQE